jgi:long-chain acyl-CoA synthetase
MTREPIDTRTLPEMFGMRVARSPATEAYRQFDASTLKWVGSTWAQVGDRVAQWTRALAALQLPRGSRIAILLPNGIDAVCIDQAALALACIPVPMNAIDNPGNIAYIMTDSGASVLVVAGIEQWHGVAATGAALPDLRCIVVTDNLLPADDSQGPVRVVSLATWLEAGSNQAIHVAAAQPPAEGDLAALVYTSGTTGKPKGVMLTHANVMSNLRSTLARVSPMSEDVLLSFLPLSHTFERTAGYYLPIAVGCCVAYARSIALLEEDLRTVRPTVLVSVPRIYERAYAKLQYALGSSSVKLRVFGWAQKVGWRRFCRRQRLPIDDNTLRWLDPLVWPLLQAIAAKPLLAEFGGRIRMAVSGGAPLSHPIARCFLGLGLPLLQGYGMTETSPIVAANAIDDNDPTTVGRVVSGVEVRIGDNNELLVSGPNVMQGYWQRREETARALSSDGWLKTGDQAAIENGRILILGRIKEIIVTSTGEKISPADVELAITADKLFAQALVVGEHRPFLTCVAVLNHDEWRALAASLHVDPQEVASLRAPSVLQAALQRIERLTVDFPRHAVPRAVCLTLEPWTAENSLMTPTLKLKRIDLMARFASEIDALYEEHSN